VRVRDDQFDLLAEVPNAEVMAAKTQIHY
jgi:hypothetical protein